MNLSKQFSQAQYDAFKQSTMVKQPLRKEINLHELKFITIDTVDYCGLKLGMSKRAVKDMMQILGLAQTFGGKLNNVFGEQFTNTLLNTMKDAISTKKSLSVTLLVSPDRIVQRIHKSGSSWVSTENFFDIVERTIDKSDLSINNMQVNNDGGIIIGTTNPNSEFQLSGKNLDSKQEVFQGGLNFNRNYSGVQVDPFLYRLWCANGCVTKEFEESIRMSNINQSSWNDFYKNLERIEANNFQPKGFADKVKLAAATPASLNEMDRAINLIKNNSNIDDQNIQPFIPYGETYNAFKKMGIQPSELSTKQKINARTNVSMWDIINGVTDFASHDYGFEIKNPENTRNEMMVQAGGMLTKNYDTQNLLVAQPF
jgi:hypothetical protein